MAENKILKKTILFLLPASFCILLGLISIISFALPKTNLKRAKASLLKQNPPIEAFAFLANNLLENSRFEEAERIIKLAEDLDENNFLKDVKTKKQNLDPREIKKQIEYWEEIANKKKNYRDAYLKLAVLYFNLGDKKNSLENLKTAIEIDPNYDFGKKLLEELN